MAEQLPHVQWVIAPSPRIGSIYRHQVVVSLVSLPISPAQRHNDRRKDTFNNATDEDKSSGSGDESEGSVSGDSLILTQRWDHVKS